MTTHAKGEVWDTNSRKGLLTVQLEGDADMRADDFFEATIIEGRATYASIDNRRLQRVTGMGTPGDTISMRTTLTTFLRRREDLEKKIAAEQAKWREPAVAQPSNG